ncbi:DUF1302 domain-containing protein [Paraburkholderia sp. GAS32]|uniref:DUF1302 domain-containing protein n=1 Tax=Paraburkholderia sp. GAS32 TaxID=3035129 RepID=UPI003D196E21
MTSSTRRSGAWLAARGGLLVVSALTARLAFAVDIEFDNPEEKASINTTISYGAMYRLHEASPALLYSPSNFSSVDLDDGDTNFRQSGLVSNRASAFTEIQYQYGNYGFRLSGDAYYDTVYNKSNQNNSPGTVNSTSVPANRFTAATTTTQGRNVELDDAFVFGKFHLGAMPLNVKVGQFAQIWGETLFFGSNGIAAGMSPLDIDRLVSVPSSQTKELLLPVPQIAATLQMIPGLSLSTYYQLGWRSDQLPPAGSFLSSADVIGQGAESFRVGGTSFSRAPDIAGKGSGQYGVAVKYTPVNSNVDLGFYALRYNSKDPAIYLLPGSTQYKLVYPEGIKLFGASFSTNLGDANVAGELSYRNNMPLVSDVQVDPTGSANNDSRPLYAVGDTLHANLSVLYSLPRSVLWPNATLTAEVGYNRLLKVTANPHALDPNTTRDALGVRLVFQPTYYQVIPGLDVNVPIGFGYNPYGRSAVIAGFNGGAYHGGDFSIGLSGVYVSVWKFSLSYTRFLGPIAPAFNSAGNYTFGQSLGDRDFVALTISRKF